MTRRTLLTLAGADAAGVSLLAAQAKPPQYADELPGARPNKKLKIVFLGAHVDDWISCAGTLARYSQAGHDVLCISCTPGDSQVMARNMKISVEKLCEMRQQHANEGMKIIGAKIVYLNQHNQQMRIDPDTYAEINKVVLQENPDVIFGMWPLQFHPDHRAAGLFAMQAWLQGNLKSELYFTEIPGGGEMQAQNQFVPNRYVDIQAVAEQARKAHIANKLIAGGWPTTDMWAKVRGMEYGCLYAQAFVQMKTVSSMMPENLYPNHWQHAGLRAFHD